MHSSYENEAMEDKLAKIEIIREVDFLRDKRPLVEEKNTMAVEYVTFPIDGIPRILFLCNCKRKEKVNGSELWSIFTCLDFESDEVTYTREDSNYALDFVSVVKKNIVVIHSIETTLGEDENIKMGDSKWDVLGMVLSNENELFLHLKKIKFNEYFDCPFITGSFLNYGDIDLVVSTISAQSWNFSLMEEEGNPKTPFLSILVMKDVVECFSGERMSKKNEGEKRDNDEMLLRGIEKIETKFTGSLRVFSRHFITLKTENDCIVYSGCVEEESEPINCVLLKMNLKTLETLRFDVNEEKRFHFHSFKSVESFYSEKDGEEKIVASIVGKQNNDTKWWSSIYLVALWKINGQHERTIEQEEKISSLLYVGSNLLLMGGKRGSIFSLDSASKNCKEKKELTIDIPNRKDNDERHIANLQIISYEDQVLQFLLCTRSDKCNVMRIEGVDYPRIFLRSDIECEVDLGERIEFLKDKGDYKIVIRKESKNENVVELFRSFLKN